MAEASGVVELDDEEVQCQHHEEDKERPEY
jgi:hypothetical protein